MTSRTGTQVRILDTGSKCRLHNSSQTRTVSHTHTFTIFYGHIGTAGIVILIIIQLFGGPVKVQ